MSEQEFILGVGCFVQSIINECEENGDDNVSLERLREIAKEFAGIEKGDK